MSGRTRHSVASELVEVSLPESLTNQPVSKGEQLDAAREADRQWQEKRRIEAQLDCAELLEKERKNAREVGSNLWTALCCLLPSVPWILWGDSFAWAGNWSFLFIVPLAAFSVLGLFGTLLGVARLLIRGVGYYSARTRRVAFEWWAKQNAIDLTVMAPAAETVDEVEDGESPHFA